MNISVQGSRTSSSDWEAAKNLAEDQLPPLSPEQREVARKMGIPELDYRRSALAGQRTLERMLAKTARLAGYLAERYREMAPQATIESVSLNTWDGKFEVSVVLGGRSVPLRVAEEIVDDYFDSGSSDMKQRLDHVLGLAIQAQVA